MDLTRQVRTSLIFLLLCSHLFMVIGLPVPLKSSTKISSRLKSLICLMQNYHKAPFSQTCPFLLPSRLNSGGVWMLEISDRSPSSSARKQGCRFGQARQPRGSPWPMQTPGSLRISGGTKRRKVLQGMGCGLGAKSEHYSKGQEYERVPALVSVSTDRMGFITLILIVCCI